MKAKFLELIARNKKDFLQFLRSNFELYHLSNVFFRDIHYGVWRYLEEHHIHLRYDQAEEIAFETAVLFEKEKILKRLNERTWLLNYPEFRITPVKLMPSLQLPKRSAA